VNKKRDVIFTAQTPTPELVETVTLHRDTYYDHILEYHSDMAGMVDHIQSAVEQPYVVFASKKIPDRLLFVSSSVVSPRRRDPLTVTVDRGGGAGAVTTAHYRRPRRDETVLWSSTKRETDR
jgi:hypothetical protein